MPPLREHFRHELSDLERELLALGHMVDDAIGRAMWALQRQSLGEARAIIRDDGKIDEAAVDLEEHALSLLALQGPVAGDLRLVSSFIHCAKDLERMGDHAKGIAVISLRLAELPEQPLPSHIEQMTREARAMLHDALDALAQRDASAGARLKNHDLLVDGAYQQLFHQTLDAMRADTDHVSHGIYHLWIAHNLERIADHATNIGEYVEFIVSGKIIQRHVIKLPDAVPVPTAMGRPRADERASADAADGETITG